MSILPPEIIWYIFEFTDYETLKNCSNIPYLKYIARKEINKRYKTCINILVKSGHNYGEAITQINNGCIDLYGKIINNNDIIKLAKNSFNIRKIYLDYSNIDDRTLLILAKYCPELILISLYKCSNITNNSILKLIKECSDLGKVNITNCKSITYNIRSLLLNKRIKIR